MEHEFEHTGIPIAIIGMACRLPGADNLEQYWDMLVRGGSAVVELPPERLNQELYYHPKKGQRNTTYSKLGAITNDRQFHRQACPLPAELERGVDNVHLLTCEAAAEACRHAGLDPFNLPLRNTGVYIGHAQGSNLCGDIIYGTCIEEAAQFLREVSGFKELPQPDQDAIVRELVDTVRSQMPQRGVDSPNVAINMVAGTISKAFRLTGPFMGMNSACASSLQAVLFGVRALQLGRVDMAIVGGASDCKSDSLVLFSYAQSMSETGTRPFDADADGLICGEGYVTLVLKTLPRALADGDPIQAVILGLGISSDGRGKSLWAPRKEGQVKAMERAYRHGLDMATLQYLEAHATSTSLGDATELNALADVLSSKFPKGKKIPISSVKANIGHALEAAGLSSVIKTVLCMQNRTFAPAINIRQLNSKIDWESAPFYIPQQSGPWPEQPDGLPRRAAVNAFGIGGLNMHLVMEEFTEERRAALTAKYAADEKAVATTAIPRRDPDRDAVAIIGMGCILPGAAHPRGFWELIHSGRDPKGEAPAGRWRTDLGCEPGSRRAYRTPTTLGGYITDFAYDWRAHKLPPKQVQQADPLQFMLLEAADQALVDSGYDKKEFDRTRVGVLVGTVFGGDFSTQLGIGLRLPHIASIVKGSLARRGMAGEQAAKITTEYDEVLLKHWPALIDESGSFSTSTLASRITKTMNLMGGAAAIDASDASSAAVLATAIDQLISGDCDMMFCAGGQRCMNLPQFEGMSLAGALADGSPRAPFDAAARGIVPGEGVGVVLLKRLADARRDGDRIHAIIRGIGAAHSFTPEESLQLAIDRAFQISGVDPADVALVEMDGTGLPERDQQQLRVLADRYGRSERKEPLLVSSLTAQIGHTLGASAMASVIKASLEIDSGEMPATFGLETPLPVLTEHAATMQACMTTTPLRHTTRDGRRFAAVSSWGDGLAYHILLERGEKVPVDGKVATPVAERKPVLATAAVPAAKPASVTPGGECHIYRLGAASPAELSAKLAKTLSDSPSAFAAAGGTRFAPSDRFRLAVVASSADALAKKLQMAAKQLDNADAQPVLEQQGCFYRQLPERRPRVAFLFPGQGSQYAGMLRELVRDVPAAAARMREIDIVMSQRGYQTFTQMAWENPAQLGTDVWVTQIVMLLADLIVHAAIRDLGIQPEVVAGHSYGEFAALTAADVWDLEGVVTAARARFDAIQATPTARGTLLATTAPPELIEELAATLPERAYIANYNAPDQSVVGGRAETLAQLVELLGARGHKSQVLSVPCPFHTPLMSGAGAILKRTLDSLRLRPTRVPMLSSVTNRYVADPEDVRENLAAQLTTPVRYVELVRRIAEEQQTVFVEVGPQQALTRLNRRILEGRRVPGIVGCDHSKNPGLEPLLQVRALLECLGVLGDPPAAEPGLAVPTRRPESTMSQLNAGTITHFDATQRRLDKMRRLASEGPQKTNGQGATPEPARPLQATPRNGDGPATRPAPTRSVGVSTHSVAAAPVPAPAPISAAQAAPAPVAVAQTAPTGSGLNAAELEKFLINFVVEQTGYPPEVVELDADLEADLGIDSIKKAQLFGELAEYFDVQTSDNLTLDDFPTLRHVLNFLAGATVKGDLAANFSPTPAPAPAPVSAPVAVAVAPAPPAPAAGGGLDPTELEKFLINFVVEQTGYPPEVVELDADLEADLGIDSIKKAQLFGELAEYFDVQTSDNLTLDDFPTLRHVLNFLAESGLKKKLVPDQADDSDRAPAPADHGASSGNREWASAEAAVATATAPQSDAALADVAPLNASYRRGFERGREQRDAILTLLRRHADLAGPHTDLTSALADDPAALFTAEELDELQGVAAAVPVALENILAHGRAILAGLDVAAMNGTASAISGGLPPVAGSNHDPHAEQAILDEEPHLELPDAPGPEYDLRDDAHGESHRFHLRMLTAPFKPATPPMPEWQGAALIVGDNPLGDALARLIESSGAVVRRLAVRDDLDAMLASLERIWQEQPTPHLFLVMGRDGETVDPADEAAWHRRWHLVGEIPYFLCQRWVQLAGQSGLLNRSTIVGAVAMNGDFGFAAPLARPEGGAITGLMKAIYLEVNYMRNNRNLRTKAIDAPDDEPVASLAANICQELASGEHDYEVAFAGGQRRLPCAYPQQAPVQPYAGIRPGGTWVFTGGCRGITAECALALGRRFGLKLHLVGASPPPQLDDRMRSLSAEELKTLRTQVMREARAAGQSMEAEWSRVQKQFEIDRWLRTFAEAGVEATYHACDVTDRDALAAVLETVRRESGPIEGIVHGAGIERSASYEKKTREAVLATIGAKVDGALNLLRLTVRDPVRYFIGFGSISGRLGSNGQTDYCVASDTLCKLAAWARTQRPGIHSVGFHWHPWGEVGMAARPESATMLRVTDGPTHMPKREGVEHFVRELYAGTPDSEIMITTWDYHGRYYGTANHPKADGTQPVAEPVAAEPSEPWAGLPFEPLAQRLETKMVDAPLPPGSSAEPPWQGPACILGNNSAALALRDRLQAAGVTVHMLPVTTSADEVIAELETIYQSQPPRYLFLMTGRDEVGSAPFDRASWQQRRALGVAVPFHLGQHWFRLRMKSKDHSPITIAAVTSLGGDYGLSRKVAVPEGAALAGMLKSIYIEDSRGTASEVRVKVIDLPGDEPTAGVTDAICRELAADDPNVEVAWSRGRRCVPRTFQHPIESFPRRSVHRGGNWLVTGGARGITAATAFELARRYGIKLHIIGRSPAPREDAPWRNASDEQVAQIKAQLVREAVNAGRSPEKAWEVMRSDIEIDATLKRFAAAGIEATYYECDMSNWDELAGVLERIRSAGGPIEGIVHGAGYGKSARFGARSLEFFERTLAGKLDGGVALMALTRQDPLRYFIGFGSIGGRFGGNGLADYGAANDMFAKLCARYQAERPECAVCCFDWQSWDEIGMAMLGDSAVGTKSVLKMAFIPPAEGIEHVCRELEAGLPTTEVVISDGFFERTFYPFTAGGDGSGTDAESASPARGPLVEKVSPLADGRGHEAEVTFDPQTDPFLVDHQFRGRPLLPAVIALEALAEAARAAVGKLVTALRNVQLLEGLAFHTERKIVARVCTVSAGENRLACELLSDFRNRADKLIQKDRVHVRGIVELADRVPPLDVAMGPVPSQWRAFRFDNIGPMRHGPTLHGLTATTFDAGGGWGQLVALPLADLGGARTGRDWLVSATLLDAAFYACGTHAWFNANGAFTLPSSLELLRLGRMPRDHEKCLVEFTCRELRPEHAIYDFTIFGVDRTPILRVEGHHIAMVRP